MKDHREIPSKSPGGLLTHYTVTLMIFLCTLVSYMERSGFSIAFTEIANRAKLKEDAKGRVLSSFFYGYPVMQVPGGWLASRYGGFRTLSLSFILWGLISFAMPGTVNGSNTTVMVMCRIASGASQGLFIPAAHTLLAQWIPVHERSRLVTLAMSGMYLGSAIAMLVFPYVIEHLGPAAEFRCAGLMAFAWLGLWSQIGSDQPEGGRDGNGHTYTSLIESGDKIDDVSVNGEVGRAISDSSRLPSAVHARLASWNSSAPSPSRGTMVNVVSVNGPAVRGNGRTSSTSSIPWCVMATSSATMAILTCNFAFHYATYVLMNWLPTYYDKRLNLTLYEMGNLFKVTPYVMMFFTSNAGGSLGRWAHVSRGMTIAFSRKLVNSLGFGLAIISLSLMPLATHWRHGVLYTTMALSSLGFCRGGWAVNHMDIAPRHAGLVMAIANGAGTIAGVIGVQLTGKILDVMGGPEQPAAWSCALGVVTAVCLTALLTFMTLARGEVLFH